MKNKKITEAFNKCNPNHEIKQSILDNILNQSKATDLRERVITMKKLAAAVIAVFLIMTTSAAVYAAYNWLTPREVADKFEDKKLAEAFDTTDNEIKVQKSKNYEVAFIGKISGENISDFLGSADEIHPERTYVVAAIKRNDGTEMSYDDDILVSPLIQGLLPWQYNIFTMGGSASGQIIDGILYRVVEFDSIDMFSDREIYLAVTSGNIPSAELYQYDSETGIISRKQDFDGMNLLFSIDTDKSKADPAAAEQYVKELAKSWGEEGSKDNQDSVPPDAVDTEITLEEFALEDIIYKDDELDIQITLPFYNQFNNYSSIGDTGYSYYGFYCNVLGNNIESITYSLNKNSFYRKTECAAVDFNKFAEFDNKEYILFGKELDSNDSCGYIGDPEKGYWGYEKEGASSFTVKYDEQEDINNQYAIKVMINNKDYPDMESDNIFETYYQCLREELKNSVIIIEIRFKNGSTEKKYIKFEDSDFYRSFMNIIVTE